MTVSLHDLLDGHPFERTLRASLLEYASNPWLHALAEAYGIDDGRRPRTALPLLGPWAPALPSGGWLLHLPGGRTRRCDMSGPEMRNGELTCPCGDVLVDSSWPWPPGGRVLYCCTCLSSFEPGTLRELAGPNDPPRPAPVEEP
jgi:hypothetical protein